MDTLLRRHLWALDLLVVLACAGLTAHATARVVDGVLGLRGSEAAAESAAPRPPLPPLAADKQTDAIVRRDIFCSTCRPHRSVSDAVLEPRATTLSLKLLAIMYAPTHRHWSVAIVKRDDGAVAPCGVGSALEGGATVDEIADDRLWLRFADGHRQALLLKDPEDRAEAPASSPPSDPLAAELEDGIKKTGEHHYDVRRSTIESVLGKLNTTAPPARLEPDLRGGQPVGFRLRDVRAGGPFTKIGLREGDVIAAVNGLATNVPQNALAIYASLRRDAHLSVALERDGRPITAEYDIQ